MSEGADSSLLDLPAEVVERVVDELSDRGEKVVAALQTCACRKPRPRRSSGMSVFTNDSAEAVLPTYREVLDLAGFKSLRQGSQG
jgi:hypothetical protein